MKSSAVPSGVGKAGAGCRLKLEAPLAKGKSPSPGRVRGPGWEGARSPGHTLACVGAGEVEAQRGCDSSRHTQCRGPRWKAQA